MEGLEPSTAGFVDRKRTLFHDLVGLAILSAFFHTLWRERGESVSRPHLVNRSPLCGMVGNKHMIALVMMQPPAAFLSSSSDTAS